METEAPAPSLGTGGGLNTTAIVLIGVVCAVLGLVISLIVCLFGSDLCSKVRECIEKRREGRIQGGTSNQRPGSIELQATELAGENDALVSNTSNQGARNSVDAGATGSEGNVTEVDQRPNHQDEINGSSEGCGDEQASEAEDGVDNIDASQSSVSPAEQAAEAEDGVDNMDASQSSVPPAEKAAEGKSRVGNVETSQSSVSPAEQAAEVLTNEYFMDLAKEIGSEWQLLAFSMGFTKAEVERIMEDKRQVIYRTLHVLQCWMERTKIKDKREKVKFLCKALTKCGRRELSEQVKSDAGFGS